MCKKVCRSRWSCILTPCVFWLLRSSEEECLAVAIGAYFLDIRDSCVMLLRIVGSVEVLRVVRTELMLPRGHAWTLCCRVFLCVKMIIYCRMLMITAFQICSMVQLCSASARSAMPSSSEQQDRGSRCRNHYIHLYRVSGDRQTFRRRPKKFEDY